MTQTKTLRVAAKKNAAGQKSAKKPATMAETTNAGAASQDPAKKPEAKPVKNLKVHTKKLIAKQFSQIMESMAEKSKSGSLAHAKFLFEIGGVKEDLARVRRGKAEPSLADLLMGEIRVRQAGKGRELEHPLETGDESSLADDQNLADDQDEDMGEGAADR